MKPRAENVYLLGRKQPSGHECLRGLNLLRCWCGLAQLPVREKDHGCAPFSTADLSIALFGAIQEHGGYTNAPGLLQGRAGVTLRRPQPRLTSGAHTNAPSAMPEVGSGTWCRCFH